MGVVRQTALVCQLEAGKSRWLKPGIFSAFGAFAAQDR